MKTLSNQSLGSIVLSRRDNTWQDITIYSELNTFRYTHRNKELGWIGICEKDGGGGKEIDKGGDCAKERI